MAVAGFTCVVKQTGEPVAMTAEPCTLFGAGVLFYVTNSAKRMIDPATPLTAYDNGLPVTIVSVSHTTGIITLNSAPSGAVTVTGAYLPQYSEVEAVGFELNFVRRPLESTVMSPTASAKTRIIASGNPLVAGSLRECQGSITILGSPADDLGDGTTPFDDWQDGTMRLLEVAFPAGGLFRGWVRFFDLKQSARFDGLVEATLSFQTVLVKGVNAAFDTSFAIPISTLP